MNYRLKDRDILYNDAQLGPYPDHLLKRVDKLTVDVPGPIKNYSHADAVPSLIRRGEFGEKAAKLIAQAEPYNHVKRYPVSASITEIRRLSQAAWKEHGNPVADTPAPIPDDPRVLSRHIKSFAYFLGAEQVGICEIPPGAMYTDDEEGNPIDVNYWKYAIVIVGHKKESTTAASSGDDWIMDSCSHQIYLHLAVWTEVIANYIRRLGFEARASNNKNYVTMITPMILAAGLGESSRLGIALNPFFGANIKGACVVTNMPLEPDKPIDFGLQDYCAKCRICVDACPNHCIGPGGKSLYHGYEKWPKSYFCCSMRGTKVADRERTGFTCGICTLVCPWNSPNSTPEDFKDWDGSIEWLHAKADARAQYLREHDFRDERQATNKWWFDLVDWEVTGKLEIPPATELLDVEE